MTSAFDEIIYAIASSRPEQVVGFQVSESAKQRVAGLIFREKNGGLTLEEATELADFLKT